MSYRHNPTMYVTGWIIFGLIALLLLPLLPFYLVLRWIDRVWPAQPDPA